MADLVGKRISDRYEILEMIGGGGMAHVYKGRDIILERTVAVKVLQPQYNTDDEFIRRFHREAQAATSLAHPNVVNIYDVGEEEDLYYIVMEYIEGVTLKEKIQEQGPVPLEQAVRLMMQILGAITHAHANRIIHRDIKPHNILLNDNSEAKVTDFGIARAASAATITHTNSVMGSVHYLSPEQAKGGLITEQSDIYSLGVVLYEMVTGSLPYSGDSAVSIALKHLQEPLPLPSEKRPGLPQSLENVILKATTKDPQKRYESVFDMQDDLESSLSMERRNEAPFVLPEDEEEKTKAIPIIKEKDTDENGGEATIHSSDTIHSAHQTRELNDVPPPKKKRKRRWVWGLLLTVLLLIGAAAAAFTVLPSLLRVEETQVPDVRNMAEEEAVELLEEEALQVETERIFDDEIELGHVVSQNPGAGSSVKVDSGVTLYVSDGPQRSEVPDVVGMNRDRAEEMLSEYESVEFTETDTTEHPPNRVIEQEPQPGETVVVEETTVYLMYSVERVFSLENLEGESKEAVENYLRSYNLNGSFETRPSDSVREGRVIEHSPGPYNEVTEGDDIQFVISSGTVKKEEEEPAVENVEAVIPVEVAEKDTEEERTFDIRIVYEDSTTSGPTIFVEETISETKTYRVPLEVTPETEGSYTLYVDNEEVQSNRFPYGE